MSKSEFLSTVSGMTHDQLNEFFKQSVTRTKVIYPLIILTPFHRENDKQNKKISKNKEKGSKNV